MTTKKINLKSCVSLLRELLGMPDIDQVLLETILTQEIVRCTKLKIKVSEQALVKSLFDEFSGVLKTLGNYGLV